MERHSLKENEKSEFSWQDLQGLSWIFNDEISNDEMKSFKSITCA